MRHVFVELGTQRYPIVIQSDFAGLSHFDIDWGRYDQLIVCTSGGVVLDYAKRFYTAFKELGTTHSVTLWDGLPDGEAAKSLETYETIIGFLIEIKASRKSLIVAVGGGTVGDVMGFVAATYARGMDFIQVPTTLLAQVDASVGGKTALNHTKIKNALGAFHQPKGVYIATETLSTLPLRDLRSGMAEVIKYGLLAEASLLESLQKMPSDLRKITMEQWQPLIEKCCAIKAELVAIDEYDNLGQRALLNLGHTFAHAIESLTHYQRYQHGEAVAIGLRLAARLSEQLGYITSTQYQSVKQLLLYFGLPIWDEVLQQTNDLLEMMRRDKKAYSGKMVFITLKELGQAQLTVDVDENEVIATLKAVHAEEMDRQQ